MTNKGGQGGTIAAEELRAQRRSTGTDGIDYVLGGGLPAGRVHLLQGRPRTGFSGVLSGNPLALRDGMMHEVE